MLLSTSKRRTLPALVLAAFLAALPFTAHSQSARSVLEVYDEGPVWHMVFVRTETGHREAYLDNLGKVFRVQMELAKDMGFVLDYKVIAKWPASPDDWDVLIIEKFPNMAAYDTFWEDFARVDAAVLNDPEMERQIAGLLNAERKLLGYQIGREVILKDK